MECNNYLNYINSQHLKGCCGLTILQYRKKYPNVEITSEEYRKNISIINKGKNLSDDHKKKIGNANRGKKRSDKSRQNISIGHKEYYKNGGINGMQGKKHKPESIKIIREKRFLQDCPCTGRKHTSETKKKQRIARIKNIEENHGQIFPSFNTDICKFFDYLNQEFDLNGHHALNGGEYYIKELGYWVDYYEPNLNLVVEYDEKRHYDKNNNLKKKDLKRQQEIEDFLNCKFIRIRE